MELLSRTVVRLNEQHRADLNGVIEHLLATAREHPDDDGAWTTVLWTMIDRQDRRTAQEPRRTGRRKRGSAKT
jgi:hypothetical protein